MHETSLERRRAPRQAREGRLLLEIIAVDETPPPDSLSTTCKTVDVSVGGLRLRANERIEAGSRMDLSVDVTGSPGKLLLSGEVRWSVQEGESYLVGIQLHDRPGFNLSEWKSLFTG